jgi:Bifunctional DNA primase/polymerase, N-terminal
MTRRDNVFATHAHSYRTAGFWPRPVKPGTKACAIKNWNIPDPERKLGELDHWLEAYGHWGIGVVLGSSFPDGTKLAALDIDRDEYVRVGHALLRNPPSGRIGAKGIAYFVRMRGDEKYRPLKVKGENGVKVGEFLGDKRFLVLPPTIHPDTEQAYRWVGRPLLQVDYRELPVIEA